MRHRILPVITLGVWLAACSKPAPLPEADPVLAAPPSEAQVVSDLEAGHVAGLDLIEAPGTRGTGTTAARRAASPRRAPAAPSVAAALPEAVPEVRATGMGQALAAAPVAMPTASLPAARTDTAVGHARGPMIIIRGGAGGPNDPCALHGPGRFGPGIAINNRMPVLTGGTGGGVLVNERAPRFGARGTGGWGFPRGGIR